MKNREKVINNVLIRIVIGFSWHKVSKFIIRNILFPLVIPPKIRRIIGEDVPLYFKKYFPELGPDIIKRKAHEFTKNYKNRFAYDCIILNLNFKRTFSLVDKDVVIRGRKNLIRALESSGGLLAVSAHFSSIVLGTIAFIGLFRDIFPTKSKNIWICTEPDVPAFTTLTDKIKVFSQLYKWDISFLLTHGNKIHVALKMTESLNSHDLVTTNLDVLRGGSSKKTFGLFGNASVYLPAIVGTAKVTLRTGATILPWVNTRERDGTLVLRIGEPIGPFPEMDCKIDMRSPVFLSLCERLVSILDEWIRESPEQWMYWDRFGRRVVNRKTQEVTM